MFEMLSHRRKLAWVLIAAASLLCLPAEFLLAKGHSPHDDDDAPAPGMLAFNGLQLAYTSGDVIAGQITVTSSNSLYDAQITVQVFDPQNCATADGCPYIFTQVYPVQTTDWKHGVVNFQLPSLPVSSYTLHATLAARTDPSQPDLDQLEAQNFRFGVRQSEMAGVPDRILKGSVVSLPTSSIEQTLQTGSDSGQPVQLTLESGAPLHMKVQSQAILSNGVQAPGISSAVSYIGQVVDAQGNPEYDSSVNLLLVNGQLSGKIHRRGGSGDPSNPAVDDLMVDPLSDYMGNAARDQHVVYHQNDTVPTADVGPGLHIDPPAPDQSAPAVPHLLATSQAAADTSTTLSTYIIPVSVYTHPANVFVTSNEARIRELNRALNQLRDEFKNITPRYDPDRLLTVDSFVVTSWQTADDSGYGDNCQDNLNEFKGSYPDRNVVSVLFTEHGTNCGGIGFRPAPNVEGPHALLVESFAQLEDYRAMVLMQEIGHNFDYYPSNPSHPPYDPHTSPEVSETWNDDPVSKFFGLDQCTAMHGSYSCSIPFPIYHHNSQEPLQTLAEGIERFIPEAPQVSQALIPGANRPVKDISVGADGSVWAITDDDRIWRKRAKAGVSDASNAWDQATGFAARIAVDPNGVPWVVNSSGEVYRKLKSDPADSAYQLVSGTGFAQDIGIGADNSVWAVSRTPAQPGDEGSGYEIYKWDNTAGRFVQLLFRAGSRIAVDPNGHPWLVDDQHRIFGWSNSANDFVQVPGAGIDIAINVNGQIDSSGNRAFTVAVIGGQNGGQVYKTYETSTNLLTKTPHWINQLPSNPIPSVSGTAGPIVGIGVDPSGHLWEAFDNNGSSGYYFTTNPQNR